MEKDDLLSVSMLEVTEDKETMTFPSPAEETGSPDEEPEPWEEWPTTVHAPNHLEEAALPEEADRFGMMTITQRWLPLAPPECVELLFGESRPPPLEDAGSPLGIPWGFN